MSNSKCPQVRILELEEELAAYREALTDIATSGYAYIDKAEEIAEAALNKESDDGC